jgi:hypothetical protein
MNGHFSEDALRHFAELAAQTQAADFSEGYTYDFTRCVRPDGSAYGTGGKCRKGTEGAKEIEEKAKRASGGPKKDAAKIVDGLYKAWDKAFMAFEDGESDSTPGYAGETLAPKLEKALGLKLNPEQKQKLVSALDNASDRYQEDGAKGSFSRYAKNALAQLAGKGQKSSKGTSSERSSDSLIFPKNKAQELANALNKKQGGDNFQVKKTKDGYTVVHPWTSDVGIKWQIGKL